MKLLGYIRRSRDSGTGVSEELQREKIELWAKMDDHEIVWLAPDLDESSRTMDRPSMKKALAACEAGEVEGIIAAYQSRLTRDPAHWSQLVNLATKQGWNLIACDTKFDLSTPTGRLMAGVMAQFDGYEYEVKAESLSDARRNAVLGHGIHGGVKPPLGYDWTVRGQGKAGKVLRGPLAPTAAAPRVLAGFEAFDSGASWRVVIAAFGFRSQGAAAAALRNRAYTGEAFSGKFRKPDAHPALISPELFRRVQRKLDARARDEVTSNAKAQKTPCLLAKVLRCGKCGHTLTHDRGTYRCKSLVCSGISVNGVRVEAYVLREAFIWHKLLTNMRASADIDRAAAASVWEEKLADAKAVVAGLDADLETGEIDAESYGKAATAARKTVASAQAALDSVEAEQGWLGMDTERAIEKLLDADGAVVDVEGTNSLIREIMRATVATVGRGGGSKPIKERVTVERMRPGGLKATLELPDGQTFTAQVADSKAVAV